MEPNFDSVTRRLFVLRKHLSEKLEAVPELERRVCIQFSPPEAHSEPPAFDVSEMRQLVDGHNVKDRDFIYSFMARSKLFQLKKVADAVYVFPDHNEPMEVQREKTLQRIMYLRDSGIFKDWMKQSPELDFRRSAMLESLSIFDHSLTVKLGVHFQLWGGAVQFLGTRRHQDKWLDLTETFRIIGSFSMSELGHGSNVRGIETVTTYDPSTQEFVINTPCESAQKYWIGGAALHSTHTIVFSQLVVNGRNEGVHAFIAQIRDEHGSVVPGVRIADCGHKIGLNGVDNGRIWFDHKRVPRENLLNSVADVTPEGEYQSAIRDADQRFGAFMAPLTSGRVSIATNAVYQAKIGLATAIRYALTRRAFALGANEDEMLLLDYPSHQNRLLPLLAKTYGMSFAANDLKRIYVNKTPAHAKTIHVMSSGYKAMFSWHNLRTLQECREACGGQGLLSENRVGQLKAEYDVQLTFEGDNNVLMQQVSKALLGEYVTSKTKQKPLKGLGLEHMNALKPLIPDSLNSATLRDETFQINLFQLRERDLLERLASEVNSLVSAGRSSAYAAVDSYQLAEDLGWAFSERSVLQSFIATENSQTGPSKDALSLLRTLFVLVLIDENPVFLRYGYLSPKQSQAVHKEIPCLIKEVRPQALSLVNSFGIPKAYLGPIASDWLEANKWEQA
eukprot:TRINITY_DN21107_c0_g1_i1.p1 TRINITY_DN21107_c0_g1~~TRINITY_DN21107_c0_g1_i1.p1  ORF type:complete len:700 (-),score=114.10 TRINITY_DN21107_c0_g1_i1:13-2037(-)